MILTHLFNVTIILLDSILLPFFNLFHFFASSFYLIRKSRSKLHSIPSISFPFGRPARISRGSLAIPVRQKHLGVVTATSRAWKSSVSLPACHAFAFTFAREQRPWIIAHPRYRDRYNLSVESYSRGKFATDHLYNWSPQPAVARWET